MALAPASVRGRIFRASALLVVVAILATQAAPLVVSSTDEPERQKETALLATGDDLPRSVADDIAQVAARADVRMDRRDVQSPEDLLSAIRASRAHFLVVAAHGDETGLRVGDGVVSRADLIDAIAASGAREIFFAACEIGLPSLVGDTIVHSASGPVDARVATIDAVEAWSQIYETQEIIQDGFVPAFEQLLEKYGGPRGYMSRAIEPREPLRMTNEGDGPEPNPYYYPCAREEPGVNYHCTEHTPEEDSQARQVAIDTIYVRSTESDGSGSAAASGPSSSNPLNMALETLDRLGYVEHYDNTRRYGVNWDDLWVFELRDDSGKCIPIIGLQDLAVPGYTIKKQAFRLKDGSVGERQGVSIDGDVIRLAICADFYGGIISGGYVGGGGQLEAQVQLAPLSISFTIGRGWFSITIEASFAAWFAFTGSVTGRPDWHAGYQRVALTLQGSIKFVVDGDLGFISGSLSVPLYGPRSVTWFLDPRAVFHGSSADAPAIDEPSQRANVLALTQAQINGLARDAETAALIQERVGIPVRQIPAGSIVDLSDPFWYGILGGKGEPPRTTLAIPGGIALGNHLTPSLGHLTYIDTQGCGARITLELLSGCSDLAPPQASAAEGEMVCSGAVVLDAGACVGGEGPLGLPNTVGGYFGGTNMDINGTISPVLESAWRSLDPYCAAYLTTVDPTTDKCPYTYPPNLCAWGPNKVSEKLGAGPGLEVVNEEICPRYKATMMGEGMTEDTKYYFDVSTTLISFSSPGTSLLIDLCKGLGDNPACPESGTGFDTVEAPGELSLEQYWDRQIAQFYQATGGLDGLPNCGVNIWLTYVISGNNGGGPCGGL